MILCEKSAIFQDDANSATVQISALQRFDHLCRGGFKTRPYGVVAAACGGQCGLEIAGYAPEPVEHGRTARDGCLEERGNGAQS
jgi:hypothetical protein